MPPSEGEPCPTNTPLARTRRLARQRLGRQPAALGRDDGESATPGRRAVAHFVGHPSHGKSLTSVHDQATAGHVPTGKVIWRYAKIPGAYDLTVAPSRAGKAFADAQTNLDKPARIPISAVESQDVDAGHSRPGRATAALRSVDSAAREVCGCVCDDTQIAANAVLSPAPGGGALSRRPARRRQGRLTTRATIVLTHGEAGAR